MSVQAKGTLLACFLALILTLTLPLVSEATYRAEGGEGEGVMPPSSTVEDTVSTAPVTVPVLDTDDRFPENTLPSFTETPPVVTTTPSTEPNEDEPLILTVYLHREERVVEMTLEEYIVSVVAAEMPYTFHAEALKAQAVAARTYCLYQMKNGTTHEGDADICSNSAHCAAYIAKEELIERYGTSVTERILSKVRAAVEATEGQILTYGGEPILAVFHSRSYRFTESCRNVWGSDLPYLISVTTPEEDSLSTVSLTEEQLSSLFAASEVEVVGSYDPYRLFSEKNDSGRQDLLYYGGKAIRAKLLRSQFGFRSCHFEFEETEEGWLFTVHGYGHGVGMSQYGANEMATEGATYKDILTHYYTGVSLETLT